MKMEKCSDTASPNDALEANITANTNTTIAANNGETKSEKENADLKRPLDGAAAAATENGHYSLPKRPRMEDASKGGTLFSDEGGAQTPNANGAADANETPMETINKEEQVVVVPEEKKEGDGNSPNNKNTTTTTTTNTSNKEEAPKPHKHVRSKHVDPKVLEIRRRIQVGCRHNDLVSAMEAYEEALKNDIRLEAQSFYNLLNLCDGLERSVHIGTPKVTTTTNNNNGNNNNNGKDAASKNNNQEKMPSRPTSPQQVVDHVDFATRQTYAFRIKERMTQLNLALNETAYTAIVRILSRTNEFAKAEEVLLEAETVQQCRPKLRLYSGLLMAYCDEKRMEDGLKCWKRLSRHGLQITEKESLTLMKCAHATGDINVMEAVLTDLADEVVVPSKDTVAAILEWFASPHATHKESLTPIHADDCQVKNLLREIHDATQQPTNSMGPVVDTNGWKISSAVQVNTKTGVLQSGCLKDCKLKPVPLSDSAWKEMSIMNESIVIQGQVSGSKSEFAGGKKGKKKMNFSPEKRKEEWTRFNDFLDALALAKSPLDIVIDGANVGYFKQNFGSAPKHVDYHQIDWIIQHFAKMGKRVLLVLHERHFASFLMPDKFKPLQEKWQQDGVLYKSPPGMNDDWFWLHAALKFNSLVLTNDEMRDHHFQMLAPRTFLRWKERHQIHFEFGNWEGDNKRKVDLVYPPIYSRRIQRVADGLVVPLSKRGDENRFLDGVHVASADEPKEETYLCIRPGECVPSQVKP
jgi:pentatricopeptide repeat protein